MSKLMTVARIMFLSLLVLLTGCWGRTASVPEIVETTTAIEFEDVAAPWPTEIVYRNGEEAGLLAILESLGGGVGVLDYDRDNAPDLWFPGGGELSATEVRGRPSQLLRASAGRFVPRSAEARVDVARNYSHGCTVGDFNNDGFPDVLVTGFAGVTLWENAGDGTFYDQTSATQLTDTAWSSSAGWGDVNGDGFLDLYLAHYVDWSLDNNPPCNGPSGVPDVCPPRQFTALDDTLYLNVGDGTFADSSETAGLVAGGKGLGVLLADVDDDGDLDIYVANDTTNNFLYVNDGHGQLTERGVISGTALDETANANGSMGVAVTDFDNNGQADIWVANYEDEVFALYQGVGDANFMHVSGSHGVRALGQLFVGFGCVADDFDADGDQDLAVANGHVVHYPRNAPIQQQPLILENVKQKQFKRTIPTAGKYFSDAWSGRGLATLDFDADGRPDLLFVNSQQPAALVRNITPAKGQSYRFQLVGRNSNRDAIGARVRLVTSDSQHEYVRWSYGGGSYLSSSERTLNVTVPAGIAVSGVDVQWPSGALSQIDLNPTEGKLSQPVQLIVEPVSDSTEIPMLSRP